MNNTSIIGKPISRILFAILFITFTPAAYAENGIRVNLPKDFHMQKSSPAEDFDMYKISKGAENYLTIYAGNAPKFPARTPGHGHEITELTTAHTKIISEWQNDRLIRREMLIESETPKGWPRFIHAWTAVLPEEKIMTADKILFSLRIKNMADF